MKKRLAAVLILFVCSYSFGQVSIRGGMGIQFQSNPSLYDYLNLFGEDVAEISSAGILSIEAGYRTGESSEIALETAYLFNSYSFSLGQYEISYNIIMPTLIYYYVYQGKGYNFKFGGGAGIRLVNLEQKIALTPDEYTSTGWGLLLKADGNTSLGGNVYANIGADLRYDLNGEPENNGRPIRNEIFDENVNLNSFSVGVRLGITYQF